MFRYDATSVLSSIPVPVIVVTANDDTTCKPEASAYMAETIPQAKLVTLKGGRHCALFEYHEDFHSLVSSFVASLPAKSATRLVTT
jgi:pimeloyl-ACP methyl ester carboxylesterase